MMKFQYEAPDGGVYEIEAPNEQAVQAIIQQQFGSPRQQEPKPQASVPASIPVLTGAPFPQQQTPQETPSELADVGRGVARGATKGTVGFIPRTGAFIEDAFYALPRLAEQGITGKNDYLGPQWNRTTRVNQALDNLTDLIVNRPQSATGRYAETGTDFVSGALTGVGAARSFIPLVSKANQGSTIQRSAAELVRQNASNPVLQSVGAGSAGLASQALDESGVTNPTLRMLVPMATGMVASGAASGGKNLYDRANVGKALDSPEGVRRAAGTIIRDVAQNPDTAAGRLARATGYVPGVTPTGPSASRDYGIMAAAPQLENYAGGSEVARQAQNAQARTRFIENDLGVRPGSGAKFEAAKAKAVAEKDALMQAAKPVDVAPLVDFVKKMDAPDERQKAAVTAAKNLVLDRLETKLEPVTQRRVTGQQPVPQFDANGTLIGSKMQDVVEDVTIGYNSRPGQLLALKQDIRDVLTSNEPSAQKYLGAKNAGGELRQVLDQIDNLIEQGAPGYKAKFRDPFSQAATEIDRLAYIRNIIDASAAAGPDAAGNIQMSPPKYLNQLRSSKADMRRKDAGRMTLDGLSPAQRNSLNRLYMDMAQENLINQRGVRATGSNTSRNLDFTKRIDDLVKSAENPLLSTLPGTLPVVAGGAASMLPLGPVASPFVTMLAVGAGNRIGNYLKNAQAARPARRADAVRASLGEMYTNPDAMRQGLELAKTRPVVTPDPITAIPGLLGSTFPTISNTTENKKKKKSKN